MGVGLAPVAPFTLWRGRACGRRAGVFVDRKVWDRRCVGILPPLRRRERQEVALLRLFRGWEVGRGANRLGFAFGFAGKSSALEFRLFRRRLRRWTPTQFRRRPAFARLHRKS
jgi:hypothetical protein